MPARHMSVARPSPLTEPHNDHFLDSKLVDDAKSNEYISAIYFDVENKVSRQSAWVGAGTERRLESRRRKGGLC
jgi:hypothetical protein